MCSVFVLFFFLTQILEESGILEAAFFYDQEGKLIESFVDEDVSAAYPILVPNDTFEAQSDEYDWRNCFKISAAVTDYPTSGSSSGIPDRAKTRCALPHSREARTRNSREYCFPPYFYP